MEPRYTCIMCGARRYHYLMQELEFTDFSINNKFYSYSNWICTPLGYTTKKSSGDSCRDQLSSSLKDSIQKLEKAQREL